MPNYVTNIVTLSGPPSSVIKAIEFVKPDDGEYGEVDFNKLIPMPPTLNVLAGSAMTDAISAYLSAVNPDTEDMGYNKISKKEFAQKLQIANDARKVSKINTNMSFSEVLSLSKEFFEGAEKRVEMVGSNYAIEDIVLYGQTVIENVEEYNCTDWYDWCCKHWGTKWNACSCSGIPYGSNEIIFNTAWSCPHPIFYKWSSLFPDITFNVKWADEDVGNNCGEWEIVAGQGEPEYKEDYDFACEVLGIDTSRNFETNSGFIYSIDDIGPIDETTVKSMRKDYHTRVVCLKKSPSDGKYYYDETDDKKFIRFLNRLKERGFDLDSLI